MAQKTITYDNGNDRLIQEFGQSSYAHVLSYSTSEHAEAQSSRAYGSHQSKSAHESKSAYATASSQSRVLNGGSGNDILAGGAGNDSLTGGNGNDLFTYHRGDGQDEITFFEYGSDSIKVTGLSNDEQNAVSVHQGGKHASLYIDRNSNNWIDDGELFITLEWFGQGHDLTFDITADGLVIT